MPIMTQHFRIFWVRSLRRKLGSLLQVLCSPSLWEKGTFACFIQFYLAWGMCCVSCCLRRQCPWIHQRQTFSQFCTYTLEDLLTAAITNYDKNSAELQQRSCAGKPLQATPSVLSDRSEINLHESEMKAETEFLGLKSDFFSSMGFMSDEDSSPKMLIPQHEDTNCDRGDGRSWERTGSIWGCLV